MLSAPVSSVGTTTSVRDCGRKSLREVHSRQRARRHEQRRQPVHHPDRELARRQQQQDAEHDEHAVGDAVAMRLRQQRSR